MKKFFILLLSVIFLFSCSNGNQSESPKREPASVDTGSGEDKDETPENSGKISLTLKNNSSYKVKVYFYQNPLTKSSPDICIDAASSESVQILPSKDISGDAFYFEYIIPLGDVEFPYFSYDSSKIYCVEKNKNNTLIIDELPACPSKSAYILLENQSTSSVYLTNGSSIIYPQEKNSYILDSQLNAVYLLGENNGDVYYKTNLLKVQCGTKNFNFPETDFELGNVYSFIFTGSEVVLKSVVPFDIATKEKIWKKQLDFFYCDSFVKPLIRSAKNLTNGTLVLGTINSDYRKIGLMKIDPKGNFSSEIKTVSFGSTQNLLRTVVLDFAEEFDGSTVLLIQNEYSDNSCTQLIASYNFDSKTLNWSYVFSSLMSFNLTSRNKLILFDEKVCVAGSVIENNKMYPWLGLFDKNNKTLTFWKSTAGSDLTVGAESMLTSVFYDGSDLYACGFENCNYEYSTLVHSGVIYKFNSDLSSAQKIYSKDKALFFSIDGKNNKWFVCGEFADNGNILKGVLVSKENVEKCEEPVLFTAKNPYCWFNQLCVYDSKVILCGKSCSDFAGQINSAPFTVCYDFYGKQQWCNDGFEGYSEGLTIVPNEINTYVMELYDSTHQKIQILSADLLGR